MFFRDLKSTFSDFRNIDHPFTQILNQKIESYYQKYNDFYPMFREALNRKSAFIITLWCEKEIINLQYMNKNEKNEMYHHPKFKYCFFVRVNNVLDEDLLYFVPPFLESGFMINLYSDFGKTSTYDVQYNYQFHNFPCGFFRNTCRYVRIKKKSYVEFIFDSNIKKINGEFCYLFGDISYGDDDLSNRNYYNSRFFYLAFSENGKIDGKSHVLGAKDHMFRNSNFLRMKVEDKFVFLNKFVKCIKSK